jgi:hypothetical protein
LLIASFTTVALFTAAAAQRAGAARVGVEVDDDLLTGDADLGATDPVGLGERLG